MNADIYADTAQGVVGTNMFAYCNNNPVSYIDPTGTNAIPKTEQHQPIDIFSLILALYGVFTLLTTGTFFKPIPITLPSFSTKTETRTREKTLADTRAKLPSKIEKVYYYAYINHYGELIKGNTGYTFVEIITRIGVVGIPAHNLLQRYEYSGSSAILKWADKELNGRVKKIAWGVYTHKKEHAKALATVFGNTSPPEVHGSGMYGHYNDKHHNLHFWFGGRMVY